MAPARISTIPRYSVHTHIIVWFKATRRRRRRSSKDYFFLVHNFVVGLIQKATTRPLLPVAPAVAAALLTPQKRPKERRTQNKKKKSLSKQIIVDKWRSLWSKRDWERHWITQNEIDCFRGFPNSAEQTWLQQVYRLKLSSCLFIFHLVLLVS